MLQNLDDQVRDCMQRAADCAEQAEGVADPRERAEWRSLHERYLALAKGIETRRRADANVSPFCYRQNSRNLVGVNSQFGMAFDPETVSVLTDSTTHARV